MTTQEKPGFWTPEEDAVQGWLVTALRFGDKIPKIDGFALSHLSDTEDRVELIYA